MVLLLFRCLFLLAYEFIHPTQFFMFLFDLFHLVIMTVIFYLFTKNLLRGKLGNWYRFKIYTAFFIIIILTLLVLGIVMFDSNFRCTSDDYSANYVYYVVQGFEVFISFLNFILTLLIIRKLKKNQQDAIDFSQRRVLLENELGEKEEAIVKRFQMKVLSIGLLVYSILFLLATILDDTVLLPSDSFECINSTFFKPK